MLLLLHFLYFASFQTVINGQADTKSNCTSGDRNAISICALDLQNAGLLGNPEYLMATLPKNVTTNTICGKYMKFHECASKYIKLCLDTELRYNHYLISVESWAMLCAIGEREAQLVIGCISELSTSDKFKACENLVKEQGANMINVFSNTDEKVCNLLDGNLNCLKYPMTGKCGVEPFQLLSSSYKGPISQILRNCSVTAEIKPAATTAAYKGAADHTQISLIWLIYGVFVATLSHI